MTHAIDNDLLAELKKIVVHSLCNAVLYPDRHPNHLGSTLCRNNVYEVLQRIEEAESNG